MVEQLSLLRPDYCQRKRSKLPMNICRPMLSCRELRQSDLQFTLRIPKGLLKIPIASKPYIYQNGGDWTWFGGRMVQQLIVNGFVEEAYEAIRPMIDRVIKMISSMNGIMLTERQGAQVISEVKRVFFPRP